MNWWYNQSKIHLIHVYVIQYTIYQLYCAKVTLILSFSQNPLYLHESLMGNQQAESDRDLHFAWPSLVLSPVTTNWTSANIAGLDLRSRLFVNWTRAATLSTVLNFIIHKSSLLCLLSRLCLCALRHKGHHDANFVVTGSTGDNDNLTCHHWYEVGNPWVSMCKYICSCYLFEYETHGEKHFGLYDYDTKRKIQNLGWYPSYSMSQELCTCFMIYCMVR